MLTTKYRSSMTINNNKIGLYLLLMVIMKIYLYVLSNKINCTHILWRSSQFRLRGSFRCSYRRPGFASSSCPLCGSFCCRWRNCWFGSFPCPLCSSLCCRLRNCWFTSSSCLLGCSFSCSYRWCALCWLYS